MVRHTCVVQLKVENRYLVHVEERVHLVALVSVHEVLLSLVPALPLHLVPELIHALRSPRYTQAATGVQTNLLTMAHTWATLIICYIAGIYKTFLSHMN